MSDFEFVFVLYSLLLGLSLVELLSGLGKVIELRFAKSEGSGLRVGYLTPALAAFVMLDLLSFWMFAWSVRTILEVSAASLLAVMLFASSYYLAARLVFPGDPSRLTDLDEHYFRVRRLVMVLLIALVGVQWAYLLSVDAIQELLFSARTVGLTILLVGLMIATAIVTSRRWSLVLLVALIARYLLLYLLL